jgi:phosphoribosylanthranilate isomerase
MFRIKICGITTIRDALTAVDAGADAIGLNFYDQSPRHVTTKDAAAICNAFRVVNITRTGYEDVPSQVVVGVFVNHSFEQIESAASTGIGAIQLHGDEPPELVARFPPQPPAALRSVQWGVIRARRIGDAGVASVAEDLELCDRAGRRPDAVLVDAFTPGHYGGTGETVSWVGLADHRRWLGDTPLILAGGLTPDNVAEAIRIVRPAAVDVASGVESAPGKKDAAKMRDFIAAARAAFD